MTTKTMIDESIDGTLAALDAGEVTRDRAAWAFWGMNLKSDRIVATHKRSGNWSIDVDGRYIETIWMG